MSEITNEVEKLENNATYVLIKDSFMSNWKGIDFEISLVALPVDNYKQEKIVMDNIENRSDWHYIDTQLGKTIKNDYLHDKRFNLKIFTKNNASRMYKKGGFSN